MSENQIGGTTSLPQNINTTNPNLTTGVGSKSKMPKMQQLNQPKQMMYVGLFLVILYLLFCWCTKNKKETFIPNPFNKKNKSKMNNNNDDDDDDDDN